MKSIALTQGQFAIVDDDDYEYLAKHKWQAQRTSRDTFYAVRHVRIDGRQRRLYMHAVIAQTPAGADTDHIDGDSLNNRRANLRVTSKAQNQYNQTRKRSGCTSRYRGVSRHAASGRWHASIEIGGSGRSLGYFKSEHDAAGAYDAAGIARDPEHFTPNFSASWLVPRRSGKCLPLDQ